MGSPGRPAWELVKELVAGLEQPVTLRAIGLKRDDLDELARRALEYHPVKVNPRPISTVADLKEILDLAW
jgi:alcohol dehydrogenase class IV